MNNEINPRVETRGDIARAALIKAGLALFGEYGFKATTIRMLSKEAGVNVAAIPYHFGDKEGLYMAVIEYITTQMGGYIGDRFMPIMLSIEEMNLTRDVALEAVQVVFKTIAEIFLQQDELRHFSPIIMREQINPTKAFNRLYDSLMGKIHTMLIELIRICCTLDEDVAAIKVHMLIGQVLVFVSSRELLLRQLKVISLNKAHFSLIYQQLQQHVALCLTSCEEL